MLELLKKRRTVRKFKKEQAEADTINKIVKAGLLAPSSKDKKPVELVVINDRAVMDKLKTCKAKGAVGLETSAFAIAVIADSEKSDVWIEDASIAAILMQLEAESLGIGSVWIQMRKRQGTFGDSETEVREVLNIPDNYGVVCVIAFGFKDEEKHPYDEGSLNMSKVHMEKF
ncbi:MAG: nitroreductase family protein [Sedimentibacter sp.]|uniref:nitroreductase family protein n=1 Tax=Sedimentibacter sp. TaxID=1960295 RepID=UPI00315938E1